MALRLFAMTCGEITLPTEVFLEGESGRLTVPVPCFLIDHPRGRVLFDAGPSLAAQADPVGYFGDRGYPLELAFAPGEEVATRLGACDVDAARVDTLILSHLHWDHSGGTAQLPNAQILVQRAEWEFALSLDAPFARGYKPDEFDVGQDVRTYDGEYDVFGDGSVVCLPTHGHTPGHQSLRIRHDGGEIVLAGDACYLCRTLDEMHLPTNYYDRAEMTRSLERLRALRDAGAHIFPGHDAAFWADVPQAPAVIV